MFRSQNSENLKRTSEEQHMAKRSRTSLWDVKEISVEALGEMQNFDTQIQKPGKQLNCNPSASAFKAWKRDENSQTERN